MKLFLFALALTAALPAGAQQFSTPETLVPAGAENPFENLVAARHDGLSMTWYQHRRAATKATNAAFTLGFLRRPDGSFTEPTLLVQMPRDAALGLQGFEVELPGKTVTFASSAIGGRWSSFKVPGGGALETGVYDRWNDAGRRLLKEIAFAREDVPLRFVSATADFRVALPSEVRLQLVEVLDAYEALTGKAWGPEGAASAKSVSVQVASTQAASVQARAASSHADGVAGLAAPSSPRRTQTDPPSPVKLPFSAPLTGLPHAAPKRLLSEFKSYALEDGVVVYAHPWAELSVLRENFSLLLPLTKTGLGQPVLAIQRTGDRPIDVKRVEVKIDSVTHVLRTNRDEQSAWRVVGIERKWQDSLSFQSWDNDAISLIRRISLGETVVITLEGDSEVRIPLGTRELQALRESISAYELLTGKPWGPSQS